MKFISDTEQEFTFTYNDVEYTGNYSPYFVTVEEVGRSSSHSSEVWRNDGPSHLCGSAGYGLGVGDSCGGCDYRTESFAILKAATERAAELELLVLD